MTLVIKKFTQYDPGNYKCIATNSLGKGESSIRLYGKNFLFKCQLNL